MGQGQQFPLHICLVGDKVPNDWQLIQSLKRDHMITLLKREFVLAGEYPLDTVDVLALDCTKSKNLAKEVYPLINKIKQTYPKIFIVLINGDLNQEQVLIAFEKGIADYFPDPYDVALLSERISFAGQIKGE